MGFVVGILSSLSLWAGGGGWVGGGGELIKDGHNPWFLNNKTEVSYCVLIDEAQFGVSQEFALKEIESAIAFWKREMNASVIPIFEKWGRLGIAAQKFQRRSCSEGVDLVFQLGVLNRKQKQFLRRPQNFAAITVRTSYNKETLSGRGFVYVAPMKGLLAYDGDGVVPDAWNIDGRKLLYLTLIHELGHVFGLGHAGPFGSLMSEGYVESLLAHGKAEAQSMPRELHFFTLQQQIKTICPAAILLPIWQKILPLKDSQKCITIEFTHDEQKPLWKTSTLVIRASDTLAGTQNVIVSVDLRMTQFFPTNTNLIWITAEQKFLSPGDFSKRMGSYILGTSLMNITKQGSFVDPETQIVRTFNVTFEQGTGRVSIVAALPTGEIVTLL